MLRLHHVNLGVPVDGVEAEEAFLQDVLGYERVPTPPELEEKFGRQVRWFEGDDGTQIHLSADPDHRPAARAHVALEVDDDPAALVALLEHAGLEHAEFDNAGLHVVFCQDPAGNRWELRSAAAS